MNPETLATGLTTYVVLLFSLSVHESAHGWMAFRMGDDTAVRQGRVSLNPLVHIDPLGTLVIPLLQIFGGGIPLLGWAKPTPVGAHNFRKLARGHVLVAGAGPVSNIALAVVFTVLMFGTVRGGLVATSEDVLFLMMAIGIQMNVALALFNLLPIPPLDGSWIASWGLPRPIANQYDRIVEPFGQYLLLLLFIPMGWVLRPAIRFFSALLFNLALP